MLPGGGKAWHAEGLAHLTYLPARERCGNDYLGAAKPCYDTPPAWAPPTAPARAETSTRVLATQPRSSVMITRSEQRMILEAVPACPANAGTRPHHQSDITPLCRGPAAPAGPEHPSRED